MSKSTQFHYTLTLTPTDAHRVREGLMWMRTGLEERLLTKRAKRGGRVIKADRGYKTMIDGCIRVFNTIVDQMEDQDDDRIEG